MGARTQVTYDDLSKLEYTGCTFKETLRKWPAVSGFSRMADEDFKMNGIFIPKGTWIGVLKKCSHNIFETRHFQSNTVHIIDF